MTPLSRWFGVAVFACGLVSVLRSAEPTPETLPGAQSIVYRTTKETPLRLHVVRPRDWQATDRRPALVFFFGGGWTRGTPEKSIGWARAAAALGFVGIAPDYRTIERFHTTPLESVSDARAAFRWVQAHAEELGVDPAKIVVGGSSAGGHLALWTAITSSPPGSDPADAPRVKPAALILFSAVSDTSVLSGYAPKRFGPHAAALSPVHHLDAQMPPVLAFHGDADRVVPYAQSVALRDALVAAGNLCEFITVPGGSHSFSSDSPEWKKRSRARVEEFLRGLFPKPARE